MLSFRDLLHYACWRSVNDVSVFIYLLTCLLHGKNFLSYRYMKNILVFWKQRSLSATCCIWLFEWFEYLIKIYMSLLNSSYINKITWEKKLYMNRNMHTFLLSFCQAAKFSSKETGYTQNPKNQISIPTVLRGFQVWYIQYHAISPFPSGRTDLTVALGRPLVELLRSSDTQVQKAATLATSNFCLSGAGKHPSIIWLSSTWIIICKHYDSWIHE